MTFQGWLAALLQKHESEVKPLLQDQTALHFLIVWSLFEAKCFGGFMKIGDLDDFATRLLAQGYDVRDLSEPAAYFHARYQDARLYSNLMHGRSSARLERILKSELRDVNAEDVVFFVSIVVYRYRNNMFHGNKGVHSWLKFEEQIARCTKVMQDFITHFESITPTFPERLAVQAA